MVKEVIWAPEAELDLKEILEFYYYTIKAKSYAIKLNDIFESEIEVIKQYRRIGKECNSLNTRTKITGHYQLIYEITDSIIYILRIWDSRQDPNKLSILYTKI